MQKVFRLVSLATMMCTIVANGESWLFNGTDRITYGEWELRVAVANMHDRELSTPDYVCPILKGEGDLDLSMPIVDGAGQSWSITRIGSGAFSSAYFRENVLYSLVMPATLRSVGAYALEGNPTLTNLVFACPLVETLPTSALKAPKLNRLVLNAPSLRSLNRYDGNLALAFSDSCVLDVDNFNLDSLTNITITLPKKLSRPAVLRFPSLQTVGNNFMSANQDITGLVIGGATEDGGNLRTLSPSHKSIIVNSPNLEFLVIGAGNELVFTDWSTFDLAGCRLLKRIFFAGARPTFLSGSHFSNEPNGACSICFYVREDEPGWKPVLDGLRALSESEAALFRERFGADEPLPAGTVASSVFGTSNRQFLTLGDHRSFTRDIIVRSTNPNAVAIDMMPPRFVHDAATAGSQIRLGVTSSSTLAVDGKTKFSYVGHTLEKFSGGRWIGGSVTNYSLSAQLSHQDEAGAIRLTWIYGPSYRVNVTDRGFLAEYPETLSVSYPDGNPDDDGFLPEGLRVTASVSGLSSEDSPHGGRFLEWYGEGAEILKGAGASVTFTPNGPMTIYPRVQHTWIYTPKTASVSGYGEISDGNWRLVANPVGGKLKLSGTSGYGWLAGCGYLTGTGFLDLPQSVVDAANRNISYEMDSEISAQVFEGVDGIRGLRFAPCYKRILQNAFLRCTNMQVLEFAPDALTYVADSAFRTCKSLGELSFVQANLKTGIKQTFAGCSSLTNLHVSLPNLLSIKQDFHGLPLSGRVDDWDLSSLTNLVDYGGFGHDYGLNAQKLTGTLRLPSVTSIGTVSLPAGLTGIDFDAAKLEYVSAHWASWDAVLPLCRLYFRSSMPPRNALDNLMNACAAVDGNKKMTIYCSRDQKGWSAAALTDYTEAEAAAAAKLAAALAPEERLLGIYATQGGARKAWLVHQPSPYDKKPSCLVIR